MSEFLCKSPRQRLEQALGIERRRSAGKRIDGWVPFNCGDRVCRIDDPRHIGRVESIGQNVKVRWDHDAVALFEYVPMEELTKMAET